MPNEKIHWLLNRLTQKEMQMFDESDYCGLMYLLNGDLYRVNNEFEKVINVDKNDNRLFQMTFHEFFEDMDEKPLSSIKNTTPGKYLMNIFGKKLEIDLNLQ